MPELNANQNDSNTVEPIIPQDASGAQHVTPRDAFADWARYYHGLGFNLIPLDGNKKPAPMSSNQPMSWKRWKTQRQTEQDLERLPLQHALGLGRICGEGSGGLVAIDFDGQGNRTAVNAFLKALNLPSDYPWVVKSSAQGWRVWLRVESIDIDGNNRLDRKGKHGGHIELRYTGHYTVLPPSLHPTGSQYDFASGKRPEAGPATVFGSHLLTAYDRVTLDGAHKRRNAQASTNLVGGQTKHSPYAQAALDREVDILRQAKQGERNNQLNRSAFALGQLVASGELDRTSVEESLRNAALATGLPEDEVARTLRSGLEKGLQEPRALPRATDDHRQRKRVAGEGTRVPTATSSRPLKPNTLVKDLAEAMQQNIHFARDGGKKLYMFEGGVYQPHADDYVGRRVKALLYAWGFIGRWSSHLVGEVIQYISADAPLLWERPPLNLVNVQNGLLDMTTGELLPHSPEHLSTIQLPITFDPEAEPVAWDTFCKETLPEDAYQAGVHWQIAAWLITPDTSLQKALMLVGDGGNGKSRFLAAIKALLGESNVTALSLQKLENDRFAPVRLMNKLANVCPDLPSQHLEQTATFKQLTGDDGVIVGERKFGHEPPGLKPCGLSLALPLRGRGIRDNRQHDTCP